MQAQTTIDSAAATDPHLPTAAPVTAARRVAAIAGAFCVVISVLLAAGFVFQWIDDPLQSRPLIDLRRQLRTAPNDESIKQGVRHLDLELRRRYFTDLHRNRTGTYLLIAGATLFVLSGHHTIRPRIQQYFPTPNVDPADTAARESNQIRRSVWMTAALLAALFGSMVMFPESRLPSSVSFATPEKDALSGTALLLPAGQSAASPSAPIPLAVEPVLAYWPRFRGPQGSGYASATDPPIQWDGAAGNHILWTAPIPLAGFGSPIVWGQKLFLTGADESRLVLMCFDTDTGVLLWNQPIENVPGSPAEPLRLPEETGLAASTPATDGHRVYVIFANGDLAAFDFDGKPLWSRNLGVPRNMYGHAASLATWQDRLLVQFDQETHAAGYAALHAFDGSTGRPIWQRKRDVTSSWSTPIVIQHENRNQVITAADPWVIAYDPATGRDLWRVECLGGDITSSPIYAGGRVLVISPWETLVNIRPDGTGNVTETHVAWSTEDALPDITSPVTDGQLIFTVTSDGLLSCFAFEDGTKHWEQDLQLEFHASPAWAGNRVYLTSKDGMTIVIQPGTEYVELARSPLGESVHASPAFVGTRIYIRGTENLYCVQHTPDEHDTL